MTTYCTDSTTKLIKCKVVILCIFTMQIDAYKSSRLLCMAMCDSVVIFSSEFEVTKLSKLGDYDNRLSRV